MLKTESNTPEMDERIQAAFKALHPEFEDFNTSFEHGQWWVFAGGDEYDYDITFSVEDAEGDPSHVCDGFCFEEC